MKIGFDFDDVSVDFVSGLLKFVNKKYERRLELEDIRSYNLWECGVGKTREDAIRIINEFYESEEFEKLREIPDARSSLFSLIKQGDSAVFITSRNVSVRDKTQRQVDSAFFGLPVLYSRGHQNKDGKTKAELCCELGVDFFIEDGLDYALECAFRGTKTLLFTRPWNQDYCGNSVIRVKNWREIMEQLGR